MSISVFGSTGFIGSRFCELYPDEVDPIYKFDRYAFGDQVLYLISTTHNYNPLYIDVETNLLVLSQALEKLHSYQTFNFISSWFVYGERTLLPAQELDDRIYPLGNYAFTKRLAESLVRMYCEREKINYRIFRLANVFGKGDVYSQKKNILQYLINEMEYDRPIELFHNGDYCRDYIHVDDVCRILHDGMKILPENKIYNVGSGVPIYLRDAIDFVKDVLGSKSEISSYESGEEPTNIWLDVSKIDEYGLCSEFNFYEKLKELILDES